VGCVVGLYGFVHRSIEVFDGSVGLGGIELPFPTYSLYNLVAIGEVVGRVPFPILLVLGIIMYFVF
jgi:hypothetical protein